MTALPTWQSSAPGSSGWPSPAPSRSVTRPCGSSCSTRSRRSPGIRRAATAASSIRVCTTRPARSRHASASRGRPRSRRTATSGRFRTTSAARSSSPTVRPSWRGCRSCIAAGPRTACQGSSSWGRSGCGSWSRTPRASGRSTSPGRGSSTTGSSLVPLQRTFAPPAASCSWATRWRGSRSGRRATVFCSPVRPVR